VYKERLVHLLRASSRLIKECFDMEIDFLHI
jgi:hypothetical protein